MAVTMSDALWGAMWDAKEAATDGNKTLAAQNAVRSGIGTPYRRVLRQDGVVRWSATVNDYLQIGLESLILTNGSIVQDVMVAGAIASGAWKHSIENYYDSGLSITTDVTQAGGADTMSLSANLTDNGTLQCSVVTITVPNFDTVGSAAFPTSSDSRCVAYFDAQVALDAQAAAVTGGFGGDLWPQFNNNWFVGGANNPPTSGNRMSQVPDVAGYTNNGILQFIRTADPVNGAKKCFKHRIAPPIDLFATDTVRSAYLTPDYLPYSVEMWVAFAIRFEGWPDRTVTFFDCHDNNELASPVRRDAFGNAVPSPHRQSPVQCWLDTNGTYTWGVNGCYLPNYTREQTVISLQTPQGPVSANASTASSWICFAVNYKLGRSMAEGPFAKIYRGVGTSGAVELVHDISGVPVGYYDTPIDRTFLKLGIYQWDVTQGYYDPVTSPRPCSDFTIETKGLFVYRAGVGSVPLTGSAMIALVRSKL